MPRKVSATGFAAIPYRLMDQADAVTWAVYAVLHRHGWNSSQGCWTSIQTIHQETGISEKIVRRCLSWLKRSGWITSIVRPGFSTVYFVKIDGPGPLAKTPPLAKTTGETPGKNARGPLAKTTGVPLAKTTGEQEPNNKNPITRTQNARARVKRDSKKQQPDPNRLKRLQPDAVPENLSDCRDLLIEFWSHKKGVRSTPVLNRICNKLSQMTSAQRQDALERAISSGWGDVFIPFAKASQSGSQATESKHPAYRSADEVLAESDRLAQQNREHLRQKALDQQSGGVLDQFLNP